MRGSVVALVAMLAATTACGGQSDDAVGTTPATNASTSSGAPAATGASTSTTLLPHPLYVEGPLRKIDTGGAEMDAALEGRLIVVDGCLLHEFGDERALVLWPLDVHWDDETQEVVFPRGDRLPLGTDVVLGGGYVTTEEISTYWENGQAAIETFEQCVPSTRAVWVAGTSFRLQPT